MRLDRILQVLLPHDEHFYSLFEESALNVVRASELMIKLAATRSEDWPPIVQQIGDIEHQGDDVTHQIFSELSSTFVTPFDPEDIHLLASMLDDILDNIDGSARRLMLYKVEACPPDMVRLIDSLHGSVSEVVKGVHLLRKLNKPSELRAVIRRINNYEHEADAIFSRGVADLFDRVDNPRDLIKLKEIYVALETATDKCEDTADVLETILIKHA